MATSSALNLRKRQGRRVKEDLPTRYRSRLLAALLAVEGSASSNHGRVVQTFARLAGRRGGKPADGLAKTLARAHELRAQADHGDKDLTQAGRPLRRASRRSSSSA